MNVPLLLECLADALDNRYIDERHDKYAETLREAARYYRNRSGDADALRARLAELEGK